MNQVLSPKRFAVILITSLAIFLHFSSSHPVSGSGGYTAAPGDSTCLNCHNTGSINGNIEISGIPAAVDGGVTYPLTVTINNTVGAAARAGFQMLTLRTSNNTNSGTYTVPTGTSNVTVKTVGGGPNPKNYAGHQGAQTFGGGTTMTYDVEWTAPSNQDGEEIRFYAAALLGNGTGVGGDRFVTTNFTSTINEGSGTPLSASFIDVEGVSCELGNDGTATVVADGGTGSYTYNWDNGETQDKAIMLSPGDHDVTVSDGTSNIVETVNIADANSITFDVTTTDIICFGESSGSAAALATGGAGGFEYAWSNGGSGSTQSNLMAGNYEVTTTDANECEKVRMFTINQPNEILMNIDQITEISCNGESNGAILVGIVASTNIINYSWTPNIGFQNDNEINGIPAGTYTLEVTDDTGCTSQISQELVDPEQLTLDIINIQNESCSGANDGQATASGGGGAGSISYEWSTGSTTETNINLSPGTTYTVTATDANGCSVATDVNIFEGPVLNFNIIILEFPTCGNNNGSAEIIPDPSLTNVTYQWFDGQSTAVANNLPAGSVSVTVSSGACSKDTSFVIPEMNTLVATLLNSSNPTCNNGSNGTANINVTGGTAPYTILWPDNVDALSRDDLSAGNYMVTISDADGCSDILMVLIEDPEPITLVSDSIITAGCAMVPMGSISITITGGTAPYNYQWSNGGDSTVIDGLDAGPYSCTIFDDNGCIFQYQGTVLESTGISVTESATNVTCFGDNNGSLLLEIIGESGPYSVDWGDGLSMDSLIRNDLPEGHIVYTVTDRKECQVIDSVLIESPLQLTTNGIATNETFPNANDGNASINPMGGTSPYSILWSTGDTLMMIDDLMPGTYTVELIDANECSLMDTLVVNEYDCLITLSLETTNVSCYNTADGSAAAIPNNGNMPYTYLWNTGDITMAIDSLSGGIYSVTVTDSIGCQIMATDTISEPDSLVIVATVVNPTSVNSTGSIGIDIQGGNSPYFINWSNGGDTAIITDLLVGTYSVIVTDANGCTAEGTYNIEMVECLDSLVFSNVTELVCFDKNEGTITALLASGDTVVSYVWSNGAISATVVDLAAGSYAVAINTANGCLYSDSIVLAENPEITANDVNITDESSIGANDGSISVTPGGGVSDIYTYQWFDESNNVISTDAVLTNFGAGLYFLCITDENNCNGLFGPYEIRVVTIVEDVELANVNIYPVPANDKIFVNHKTLDIQSIEFLNLDGKKLFIPIFKGLDQIEIDLKDIPMGSYIIKLKSTNNTISKMISIVK